MQITAEQHRIFSEVLAGNQSFVVTTHMHPDGDALGSQIALARFLTARNKDVRLINGDPAPALLSFVTEGSTEIEIYDPATHDELLRNVDRVVLVDNSAPDRLGRMEPIMTEVAANTLCIDHHPTRDAPWGDTILQVGASATAALVWQLIRQDGWEPDARSCEAVFVGIVTDTGFFRFNSACAHTHRIAAELLDRGVEPGSVYRRIYERNSEAYTRLLGHALTGLRIEAEGRVALVVIRRATIEELAAGDVDTSEITSALLALEGVQVVLLFRELAQHGVKVSLRSKGTTDVHKLASGFGGGGHRNASGIVLDEPIETVVDQVLAQARTLVSD